MRMRNDSLYRLTDTEVQILRMVVLYEYIILAINPT